MKKIFLMFFLACFVLQSLAQGTVQLTPGANIKTANNAFIVLDNMNLVNNGSFVQAVGDGTTKLLGNNNTTTTGIGTTTLDKLEIAINNGFANTLTSTIKLKNVLTLTKGQLRSNGFLILVSDANNTARVAPVTSLAFPAISGNVIVERFITSPFNRSSWRLLTAPLKSTTGVNGTIYDHWQNGGINIEGINTRITGPAYNINNGLDALTNGATMQWWAGKTLQSVSTTNNPAITPLFTSASSSANKSYFTLIKGGRLNRLGQPNTTTLSATGSLQTLDQPFATNTTPDGFTLIGNPYASPVDLNKFTLDNVTSNIKSTYYYWDPYLTGVYGQGAYVTVSYDDKGLETIIPTGVGHTKILQSGQAMFVQTKNPIVGVPMVTFKEKHKDEAIADNTFYGEQKIKNIAVTLNVVSYNASIPIDGIVVNLDNSYSSVVDDYDAVKLNNTGESIAFIRNGISLAIERRPLIKTSDVLYLGLTNLKPSIIYQFKFNALLNSTPLQPYLIDNYLNLTTPIDVYKDATVNFTINSDSASTGGNRFSIVFSTPSLVVGEPSIEVYPNPITDGNLNLRLKNLSSGIYSASVYNSLGQAILIQRLNYGKGMETMKFDKKLAKGEYVLEVTFPDNSKYSTKVISY